MSTIVRAKYPRYKWVFDYNSNRERWETYRQPLDWPDGVYSWLWRTFGHPGCDPEDGVISGWDYHGGWIYFYKEEHVSAFLLKWS